MAERYQVRGRRIWDSHLDMYTALFDTEELAEQMIRRADGYQFKRLDQWQNDKPQGERYQVKGRRIWDSETDTYSCLMKRADNAEWCAKNSDLSHWTFKPLSEWQDDKPKSDQVEQPANDPVNNPAHYTQGDIQCDDAIRAMLGPEGYSAYVRGTMLAYMWRLPHKGQAVLDAGKVRRYSDWLVEIVNKIYG